MPLLALASARRAGAGKAEKELKLTTLLCSKMHVSRHGGPELNVAQAAEAFAPEASGNSPESVIKRLKRKYKVAF